MNTPGTIFSGSDWKYGWPHKFYFDILNPNADKIVETGRRYGPDITKDTPGAVCDEHSVYKVPPYYVPQMGTKKSIHLKFYNQHLEALTPEEVEAFSADSQRVFAITFKLTDRGLQWRAVPNVQTYGAIDGDKQPKFGVMEL